MPTRDESCAQLLSLAVHEFRTPASVVGGYLRMLQRDTDHPLSDRQRRMVEEAERSCARLVALIAELGEISKFDAGAAVLAHQPCDLFLMVREVAGGVHEAGDRSVRLEVRGESGGATMTGDVPRIRTAFDAIFRAILREQSAPCTVVAECRIDRRSDACSAVVVVGPEDGVRAAYEAAAGPFDDRRGGLGLALPIARRVIEAHGGRLRSPVGEAGRGFAVMAFPVSESPA